MELHLFVNREREKNYFWRGRLRRGSVARSWLSYPTGFDVFEVPYITAEVLFTHCSQFHNCIPYTDKKSFTFNTQSHVATFFSQNRVYFPLFLQETF